MGAEDDGSPRFSHCCDVQSSPRSHARFRFQRCPHRSSHSETVTHHFPPHSRSLADPVCSCVCRRRLSLQNESHWRSLAIPMRPSPRVGAGRQDYSKWTRRRIRYAVTESDRGSQSGHRERHLPCRRRRGSRSAKVSASGPKVCKYAQSQQTEHPSVNRSDLLSQGPKARRGQAGFSSVHRDGSQG